jgi:hypothetical protein
MTVKSIAGEMTLYEEMNSLIVGETGQISCLDFTPNKRESEKGLQTDSHQFKTFISQC